VNVIKDYLVRFTETERVAIAAELALIWGRTPSADTPTLCILRDRLHASAKGQERV
jgi:hypothetical protein